MTDRESPQVPLNGEGYRSLAHMLHANIEEQRLLHSTRMINAVIVT